MFVYGCNGNVSVCFWKYFRIFRITDISEFRVFVHGCKGYILVFFFFKITVHGYKRNVLFYYYFFFKVTVHEYKGNILGF